MRRFISILILGIYFVAYGEGHQLLRIPYLVQHFQKHQQQEPSISFYRFIEMHYLEPIAATDDFMQDQDLPLRSVDLNLLQSLWEIKSPVFEIQAPLPEPPVYFCFNEINKPQYKAFDIFQPPRCA